MSDDFNPGEKTRLLLVEGRDDAEFFTGLAQHLGYGDKLHIAAYRGRNNLKNVLLAVAAAPYFQKLRMLGIVRDADYNTDAFASVLSALKESNDTNSRSNPGRLYPLPDRPGLFTEGRPRAGVLVLPDGGEGMLETVILDVVKADPLQVCIQRYLDCLQEQRIKTARERVPKAQVRLFLTGKMLDRSQKRAVSFSLEDVYTLDDWNWEHPALKTAADFLRQLATLD